MKGALFLVGLLAAASAGAQQFSSTTAEGAVPPPPFTCAAAPTGNMPFALLEWPLDVAYDGIMPPPKALGLRWCSRPGNEATANFTPAPWTLCAKEGGTCTPASFPAVVLYTTGAPAESTKPPMTTRSRPPKVVSAPIACTNAAFGDPWVGVVKQCWVRTFALEAVPFEGGPQAGRGYQVGSYFFGR